MTSSQLPNYLRSRRKRLALSQDEMALLLGVGSGAKICRDERFVRRPTLETALAYEAVFRRPVRELFKGLYQSIERDVAARAKTFATRMECQPSSRQTDRKRQAIADIIAGEVNNTDNS